METRVIAFQVDGLNLAGHVVFPTKESAARSLRGEKGGARRHPGLILCHGMPATKHNPLERGYVLLAERFAGAGFVTMHFNFRGAGQSQGDFDIAGWERDLKGALDYLVQLDEVDAEKLFVLGSSAGGAVATCVAADDMRVSGLALLAAPAHLDVLLQPGHAGALVEHLRNLGLIKMQTFPASVSDWIEGFRKVRAMDCIGRVAPRPVLIVHGDADDTVPVDAARCLYEAAGEPKEMVILPGSGHRLRLDEHAVGAAIGWLRRRVEA